MIKTPFGPPPPSPAEALAAAQLDFAGGDSPLMRSAAALLFAAAAAFDAGDIAPVTLSELIANVASELEAGRAPKPFLDPIYAMRVKRALGALRIACNDIESGVTYDIDVAVILRRAAKVTAATATLRAEIDAMARASGYRPHPRPKPRGVKRTKP